MRIAQKSRYAFNTVWPIADRVKGWLEHDEGKFLYELAQEVGGANRIVELGSYCGRSSILLAAAVAKVSSLPVICVDTFRGSLEHQPDQPYFDSTLFVDGAVDTYPSFWKSVEQAGVQDYVDVVRSSTLDAAISVSEPIGLLFVDADHSYAAVKADLEAWNSKVIEGGLVVMHDVGDWSGPTRAAADLIDAGFERQSQVGTALALRKPRSMTNGRTVK